MKTQPRNVKLHYNAFETKIFLNEFEYDKLYPSGSAPSSIYGIPKMNIS